MRRVEISSFLFFCYRFALQHDYHACCKTSRALYRCRIISRRSRVTHATAVAIFCVIAILAASLRPLPCYSYVAHHVTHCLVSMLCHFAILRMSRVSLYVAFVVSPITSVWFPVSLRPSARFLSVIVPQDALAVPFSRRLTCRSQRLSYLIHIIIIYHHMKKKRY